MKEEDIIPREPKWDLVWKAPVQQRIYTFMWLILHDRLLGNANRLKRHLTGEPRCLRCNLGVDETLLHMFRDCLIAQKIWLSVGDSALHPALFEGNLTNWMVRNLEAEGQIYSERWPTCFAITLWWVWKWRNMRVFDRLDEIPLNPGQFIRGQAEVTWNVMTNPKSSTFCLGQHRQEKHEVLVRWIAPPNGWWTLNTYGAAKGTPGLAGGGGVIRDTEGRFVKGFALNFGICHAYRAEFLALEHGLHLAKQLGISKLVVQMDNQACVDAIANPSKPLGECVHIVNHCRNLCNSFVSFSIFHCFREENRVADKLANMGVILQERVVYFDDPPIDIKDLIWEDNIGVALPRMVV